MKLPWQRDRQNPRQRARAKRKSTVLQAGGDITYVTQHAQEFRDFLQAGEYLAEPDENHFSRNDSALWGAARESIWTVSLYGRRFMPPEDEVAALARRLPVRIVLVDPDCDIARDVARGKARFSRVRTQDQIWDELQGPAREEWFMQGFRNEVHATVEMVRAIKAADPSADIQLRLIDFLPRWKGTIVDGQRAVYVIYDVPRQEIPFRWTEERELIAWFQQMYVEDCWRRPSAVVV